MLRSLYSAISGMRSKQTKLDVIANNIANVNTTGFKTGRVRFHDMLSQTIRGGTAPTGTGLAARAGTNPSQVGLGVAVGAIDTSHTQGALQTTGRVTDLAIQGGGYFVLRDGNRNLFARDGAFSLSTDRTLVSSATGFAVMGWGRNVSPPASMSPIRVQLDPADGSLITFTIGRDGVITGINENGMAHEIGRLALATFPNPEGLLKEGGNFYATSPNSGSAAFGVALAEGRGSVESGMLEMSNVDLATEFTEMISTSRAFQANSRTVSTSDEMLQELIQLKR